MPARPLATSYGEEAECLGAPDFADFYALYRPRLQRYLQRAYPSADHEAALQETFARAFRHYDAVGPLPDAWPWLATVLTNIVRNHARGRRGRLVALEDACHLPDTSPLPEARLVSLERVRAIGEAIEALPRRQRELVRLMIAEGISATEAGDQLGLQPAAARQQLHRLRGRLRAELAKHGGLAAVIPLPAVLRRILRRTGGAQAVSMATLAGVLGVTAAVGVASPGLRFDRGSERPVSHSVKAPVGAQPATSHRAATRSVLTAKPAAGSGHGGPAAPVVSAPAAVRIHHHVAAHPMRAGAQSDAGLSVDTPVGTYSVDFSGVQQGKAEACHVVQQVC
jgi:RNA polymerase sigma-70 factor (ECF subfamily)